MPFWLAAGAVTAGMIYGTVNSGGVAAFKDRGIAAGVGQSGPGRRVSPAVPVSPVRGTQPAKPLAEALPDASFRTGEVYAFPNPARHGRKPAIHVEAGIADQVTLRFYDLTGKLVHEARLSDIPKIINDGQGPEYAYEYLWDQDMPSGSYLCSVRVRKDGHPEWSRLIKLAVIR